MSAGQVLQEISEAIGFRGAHAIATARAGTSFYVPTEDPPPHHWLRNFLTDDELRKLVDQFGGATLPVPQKRDQSAHRIWIALRNGVSVRDAALITGISERRVRGIKADLIQAGRLPKDKDAA